MTDEDRTGFRVTRLYHPSLHVRDLGEAEEFFSRVFGRPSVRLATMFEGRSSGSAVGRPVPDHSTFTMVADVLVDSIDPRRYVVAGEQRYADVEQPVLRGMGWYVDGVAELYRSLRRDGVALVDQLDAVADTEDPPTAVGSPMPLFFTVDSDVGLRHELVPEFPFALDPRTSPRWSLPTPSDDDALGIVDCAHHHIATADPGRAVGFLVSGLGGRVLRTGRDEALGADVTDVALADAVLRLAVVGTPASTSTDPSGDEYRSIAWRVLDLDRVDRHLRSVGVEVALRTADDLIVDPATALGIPWRFMTS